MRMHITTNWCFKAVGILILGMMFLSAAGCAEPTKPAEQKFMFWPPSPDQPHIQYLTTIMSTVDITGSQAKMDEFIYGKTEDTGLPFVRPYGVRMSDGTIYVCDATAATVSILDLRKKQVRVLGAGGDGRLVKPIDIAVADDETKYVADTGLNAIVVFDAQDQFVGKITPAVKMRPVSLAVRKDEVFVADMLGSCVRVFDRFKGTELRQIGETGTGEGKLGGVMGIALDAEGNIFINDVVGCRAQKFTLQGKFLWSVGGIGEHPGNLVRPKHMAVDSSGIMYVVDAAFQNVQMFNENGELLLYFGGAGVHPGAMNMPTGICVSDKDLDLFQKYVHPAFQAERILIVTNNTGPYLINIYALGHLKPGKTLADISASRIPGVFGFDDNSKKTPSTMPTTLPNAGPATPPATSPATLPAATAPAATAPRK